jgi:hypothetical protein
MDTILKEYMYLKKELTNVGKRSIEKHTENYHFLHPRENVRMILM